MFSEEIDDGVEVSESVDVLVVVGGLQTEVVDSKTTLSTDTREQNGRLKQTSEAMTAIRSSGHWVETCTKAAASSSLSSWRISIVTPLSLSIDANSTSVVLLM